MEQIEKLKKEYFDKFGMHFEIFATSANSKEEIIKVLEYHIKNNKPQEIKKDALY